MASQGQMNLASIVAGLARGLSEGLSYKRQYDIEQGKARATQRYRQQQLGLEERRMTLAEERAESEEAFRSKQLEGVESRFKKTMKFKEEELEEEQKRKGYEFEVEEAREEKEFELLKETKERELDIREGELGRRQLDAMAKYEKALNDQSKLEEDIRHNKALEKEAKTKTDISRIKAVTANLNAQFKRGQQDLAAIKQDMEIGLKLKKEEREEELQPFKKRKIESEILKNRSKPFYDRAKILDDKRGELRLFIKDIRARQKGLQDTIITFTPTREGKEASPQLKKAEEMMASLEEEKQGLQEQLEKIDIADTRLTAYREQVTTGNHAEENAKGIGFLTQSGMSPMEASGLVHSIESSTDKHMIRQIYERNIRPNFMDSKSPRYNRQTADYLQKLIKRTLDKLGK